MILRFILPPFKQLLGYIDYTATDGVTSLLYCYGKYPHLNYFQRRNLRKSV
jgi:hypothetical protein